MGRIRSIKPDFFRHEELYQSEHESGLPLRVAFAGLFTVADREGRFKWKPKTLKMDILPWDEVDFGAVLLSLRSYGFVKHYKVDGKEYGWIPTFKDHQVINNKEGKSTLPEYRPELDATFTRAARVPDATLVEGKGREGREHILRLMDCVCEIFGRKYELPENRLPALANWYETIDHQVDKILQVWDVDTAIKQVTAYIKHCSSTNRKKIGTDHKVAETLLQADWVGMTKVEMTPSRADPYDEARHNKTLWTKAAWETRYAHLLNTDNNFRQAFGYEKLRDGGTMGSNIKSRQSA
jgi:hypothetical protein